MLDSRYFRSLTSELNSLKNRVRSFIRDRHWQTDGEWKESVLRTILRRHLPKSVEIGRGFVITDEGPSKQKDILIYDSTKPLLFQDGDLVFVTPDAVLGIIEVKTSLDASSLKTAVQNLSTNIQLIQSKSTGRRVFGLFSYDDRTTDIEQTLKIIKDGVPGRSSRAIHCICLGKSKFIRFWHFDPVTGRSVINTWHGYNLKEKAPGYFIHNVIEEICPQSVEENKALWYPKEGKESFKVGEIAMERTIDK
jgi:hypothetical protein